MGTFNEVKEISEWIVSIQSKLDAATLERKAITKKLGELRAQEQAAHDREFALTELIRSVRMYESALAPEIAKENATKKESSTEKKPKPNDETDVEIDDNLLARMQDNTEYDLKQVFVTYNEGKSTNECTPSHRIARSLQRLEAAGLVMSHSRHGFEAWEKM